MSGKVAVHHIDAFLHLTASSDGDCVTTVRNEVEQAEDMVAYHTALGKALASVQSSGIWPADGKLPPMDRRPSVGLDAAPGVRARIDVMSVILADVLEGKHPLADVSQSMDRVSWRTDGTVPTLTTNSIIFSFTLGKFIHPMDLARSMGLPADLNLSFLTVSQQRKIVGNGYIVPLAALAVAAVCKETGHIIVGK